MWGKNSTCFLLHALDDTLQVNSIQIFSKSTQNRHINEVISSWNKLENDMSVLIYNNTNFQNSPSKHKLHKVSICTSSIITYKYHITLLDGVNYKINTIILHLYRHVPPIQNFE